MVEHDVPLGRQMRLPSVPWRIVQPEVRVIPHRDRHRLHPHVLDRRFDLQLAVRQPVRHSQVVREGELRHQLRMPPELDPARHVRRRLLRHPPQRREVQQPVDRQPVAVAPQVAEIRIQPVALAIHEVFVAVDAIRPRSEERDAAQRRRRLERLDAVEGKPEDVPALHLHFVRHVANGGDD
jgi:hypothetical protein